MSWRSQLLKRPPSISEITEDLGHKLIHQLWNFQDERGNLSVANLRSILGSAERIFFVYGSTISSLRGDHAHRTCSQLLFSPSGWTDVFVQAPDTTALAVRLDSPQVALLIPPMYWACQYQRSNEAVLAVVASHPYDEQDYIRDYDQWCSELREYDRGK